MNYKQIKYPQLPSCTKFFITKKYYLIIILILTCFLPKQSLAKVVWKCFARNPKENHDLCTQYTTEASCKLNSACVWASEANLSADFFDGEYRCLAIEPKDNMYCFGRNLESCGPNSICYWGFSSFHKEEEEKEEEEVDKPKIIIPDLQIKLPGLLFSDENKIEKIVGKDGVTSFSIPWIGEYIKWLFNYSLGLITLLALIVLMVGGFYWLLSGGNASRVTEAKNWISAAFSGVILAMSSYILLFTINSNLVVLPNIEIGYIKRKDIDIIHPKNYTKITGQASSKFRVTDKEVLRAILSYSKSNNIEPCIFYSIIATESSGNLAAIGHDEMVSASTRAYNAFAESGKTYKGVSPIPTNRNGVLVNDDNDCTKNPNNKCDPKTLSLDWRFSHGVGMLQTTMFPYKCETLSTYNPKLAKKSKENCNLATRCDGNRNGNGSDYGYLFSDGTCISLRDLITVDGSIKWFSKTWKSYYCPDNTDDYPKKCFKKYAGSGDWAEITAQRKMDTYLYCLKNEETIFSSANTSSGAGGGF